MNSNTRGLLARAGAAAAAAVLATPTFALAEGVGAAILIPKTSLNRQQQLAAERDAAAYP